MEMFSIGERRKSKHKFGGIKFCEGEEVREYFINPKTENIFFFFGLVCKLSYLQF